MYQSLISSSKSLIILMITAFVVSSFNSYASVREGLLSDTLMLGIEHKATKLDVGISTQIAQKEAFVDVNISGLTADTEYELTLYNSIGNVVYSKKLKAKYTKAFHKISGKKVKQGLYFLSLSANNQSLTKRILIKG